VHLKLPADEEDPAEMSVHQLLSKKQRQDR